MCQPLGGLLSFLGFLEEYVMAINARVRSRPLVVEEERVDFGEDEKEEQKYHPYNLPID